MSKLWSLFVFAVVTTMIVVPSASDAETVPKLINYQGRLSDETGVEINGERQMVFEFYDAETGGNLLGGFSETHTVTRGVFSLLIGSSPGEGVPASIFDEPSVYLSVKVDGEELLPRQRVATVGYAFRAAEADHAAQAEEATDADTVDGLHAADLDESGEIAAHAASGDHDDRYVNTGEADSVSGAMIVDSSITGTDISPDASLDVGGINVANGGFVVRPHIRNLSFEFPISDADWIYAETEYPQFGGGRRTDWSTDGEYSYRLRWGGECSGHAQISQQVSLTGVSSISFDATFGFSASANVSVRALVLIDSTKVWEQTQAGAWTDAAIDTSALSGEHNLIFRVKVSTPALTSGYANFYVDNIRGPELGSVVGVGTSDPLAKLHVDGNLEASGAISRGGHTVWDDGNDGEGSGLDADTLDGRHGDAFVTPEVDAGRSGAADNLYEGAVKLSDKYLDREDLKSGVLRFGVGADRTILTAPGVGICWDTAAEALEITQLEGGLPIFWIGIRAEASAEIISGVIAPGTTASIPLTVDQGQLLLDISHGGPSYAYVHMHCLRNSGNITANWCMRSR